MAKSLLLGALVEVLSRYFVDLNLENLKIGVWSGKVQLNNLQIRPDLFDVLNLPFILNHGSLKFLTVKVPWSSLSSKAVRVIVDGLFIQVSPLDLANLPPGELERKALADKKVKLKFAEMNFSGTFDDSDTVDEKATYVKKLVLKIADNIEVTVQNIHIRYEDSTTLPGRTFCAGLTLESFRLATVDSTWVEKFVVRDAAGNSSINKMGTVDNVAIYWSPQSTSLAHLDFSAWESSMTALIFKTGSADAAKKQSSTVRSSTILTSITSMARRSSIASLASGPPPPSTPTPNPSPPSPALATVNKSSCEPTLDELKYILAAPNQQIIKITLRNAADEANPLIGVALDISSLTFQLERQQIEQAIIVAGKLIGFGRRKQMALARPKQSPLEAPRLWWKYAYALIAGTLPSAISQAAKKEMMAKCIKHRNSYLTMLRLKRFTLTSSENKHSPSMETLSGELAAIEQELPLHTLIELRTLIATEPAPKGFVDANAERGKASSLSELTSSVSTRVKSFASRTFAMPSTKSTATQEMSDSGEQQVVKKEKMTKKMTSWMSKAFRSATGRAKTARPSKTRAAPDSDDDIDDSDDDYDDDDDDGAGGAVMSIPDSLVTVDDDADEAMLMAQLKVDLDADEDRIRGGSDWYLKANSGDINGGGANETEAPAKEKGNLFIRIQVSGSTCLSIASDSRPIARVEVGLFVSLQKWPACKSAGISITSLNVLSNLPTSPNAPILIVDPTVSNSALCDLGIDEMVAGGLGQGHSSSCDVLLNIDDKNFDVSLDVKSGSIHAFFQEDTFRELVAMGKTIVKKIDSGQDHNVTKNLDKFAAACAARSQYVSHLRRGPGKDESLQTKLDFIQGMVRAKLESMQYQLLGTQDIVVDIGAITLHVPGQECTMATEDIKLWGHLNTEGMSLDVIVSGTHLSIPPGRVEWTRPGAVVDYIVTPFDVKMHLQTSRVGESLAVASAESTAVDIDVSANAVLKFWMMLQAFFRVAGKSNKSQAAKKIKKVKKSALSRGQLPTLILFKLTASLPLINANIWITPKHSLFLSIEGLDFTTTQRPCDMTIRASLAAANLSDSLRPTEYQRIVYTPPDKDKLVDLNITLVSNVQSPCYRGYGSESRSQFATLGINVDELFLTRLEVLVHDLSVLKAQILSDIQSNGNAEVPVDTLAEKQALSEIVDAMRRLGDVYVSCTVESVYLDLYHVGSERAAEGRKTLEPLIRAELIELVVLFEQTESQMASIRLESIRVIDTRPNRNHFIHREFLCRGEDDPESSSSFWGGLDPRFKTTDGESKEYLLAASFKRDPSGQISVRAVLRNVTSFICLDPILDVVEVSKSLALCGAKLVHAWAVVSEKKYQSLRATIADKLLNPNRKKTSPTFLSIKVAVINPRLLFLETPDSASSRAIVFRAGIKVTYVVDTRDLAIMDTEETIYVQLISAEVSATSNLVRRTSQQIIDRTNLEFHVNRKFEHYVLLSTAVFLDISAINAKVSLNDIRIAKSIITRFQDTAQSSAQRQQALAAQAPSMGINEENKRSTRALLKEIASKRAVVLYKVMIQLKSINIIGMNDVKGQAQAIIRCKLDNLYLHGQGAFGMEFRGDSSFGVCVDYFNAPISLWEPILEEWKPDVNFEYDNLNGASLQLDSVRTVQINVSGAMARDMTTFMRMLTQIHRGVDKFVRKEYHSLLLSNKLGIPIHVWSEESDVYVVLETDKPTPLAVNESKPSTTLNLMILGSLEPLVKPIFGLPLLVSRPRICLLRPTVAASADQPPLTIYWDAKIDRDGSRRITVRSGVEVANRMSFPIDVLLSNKDNPLAASTPCMGKKKSPEGGAGQPTPEEEQLVSMGFDPRVAQWALKRSMNSLEDALTLCLDHDGQIVDDEGEADSQSSESEGPDGASVFGPIPPGETFHVPLIHGFTRFLSVRLSASGTEWSNYFQCSSQVTTSSQPSRMSSSSSMSSSMSSSSMSSSSMSMSLSSSMSMSMSKSSSSARLLEPSLSPSFSPPPGEQGGPILPKKLRCRSRDGRHYFLQASAVTNDDGRSLVVNISPFVVLHNYLPCSIIYRCVEGVAVQQHQSIPAGGTEQIVHLDNFKTSSVAFQMAMYTWTKPFTLFPKTTSSCNGQKDIFHRRVVDCPVSTKDDMDLNFTVATKLSSSHGGGEVLNLYLYSEYMFLDRASVGMHIISKRLVGMRAEMVTSVTSLLQHGDEPKIVVGPCKHYERRTTGNAPPREPLSSWAQGCNWATLFQSDESKITLGLRGSTSSEVISLDETLSKTALEILDQRRQVEYLLMYTIASLPGVFCATRLLTVMPRYVIVNSIDQEVHIRQFNAGTSVFPSSKYDAVAGLCSKSWHKVDPALGTKLQVRTTDSDWSVGVFDISEVGTTVLLVPRLGASSGDFSNVSVIHIEVKPSADQEHAYRTAVIWCADANGSTKCDHASFSVLNETIFPLTIQQRGIDFAKTANVGEYKDQSGKFELCVAPGQWLPFGWIDQSKGSEVLVGMGTTLRDVIGRPVVVDFVNVGSAARIVGDLDLGIGNDEANTVLLEVTATGSGKILRARQNIYNAYTQAAAQTFESELEENLGGETFRLKCFIPSINVSVVAERPVRREFFAVNLDGLEIDGFREVTKVVDESLTGLKCKRHPRAYLKLKLFDLQVDNYSETAVYPALFHTSDAATRREALKQVRRRSPSKRKGSTSGREDSGTRFMSGESMGGGGGGGSLSSTRDSMVASRFEGAPGDQLFLLNVFVWLVEPPESTRPLCNHASVRLLESFICLDSSTLQLYICDLHDDFVGETLDEALVKENPRLWVNDLNNKLLMPEALVELVDMAESVAVVQSNKIFFGKLVVHPISTHVSYTHTPFPRPRSEDVLKGLKMLQYVRRAVALENFLIELKEFVVTKSTETASSLGQRILNNLINDIKGHILAGTAAVGFQGMSAVLIKPWLGSVTENMKVPRIRSRRQLEPSELDSSKLTLVALSSSNSRQAMMPDNPSSTQREEWVTFIEELDEVIARLWMTLNIQFDHTT